MKVTKQFLMINASPKGGWTKAQLEALGEPWPPKSGWFDRVIGKVLTNEQAHAFMRKKSNQLSLSDSILN